MNAGDQQWINRALSVPRFEPYLAASGGDVDAALRTYLWNAQAAAAFYLPLQCLEVTVRNALHNRLRAHFRRDDWWVAAPLNGNGQRSVTDAERKVVDRARGARTSDDVVAELSFGFWVSLVSRGYDRELWVRGGLYRAFPHYRGKRRELHDNLVAMVYFRNRIMHHEPVHHRDLKADHTKVYRLIGYVSPEFAKALVDVDVVEQVLRRRENGRRHDGG
jgi:hypothetical protein